MICVCHLWAHALYLEDAPLWQFSDAKHELDAFMRCTLSAKELASKRRESTLSRAAVVAAQFVRPDLCQALVTSNEPGSQNNPGKPTPSLNTHAASELVRLASTLPCQGLTHRTKNHRAAAAFERYQLSIATPPNSFWCLQDDPNILMPSPPLHLYLRAGYLPLLDMALLISQYCGTYRLRPDAPGGSSFGEPPLAGRLAIHRYAIQLSKQARNRTKLVRALKIAFDGAASPREAELGIALSAPGGLGCAGLPRPQLNQVVTLSAQASALVGGRRELHPDLLWPDEHLVVEYQGRAYHEGLDQGVRDDNRAAALELEGYTVLRVTDAQVCSPERFSAIAQRVAALLHKTSAFDPKDDACRNAHASLLVPRYIW